MKYQKMTTVHHEVILIQWYAKLNQTWTIPQTPYEEKEDQESKEIRIVRKKYDKEVEYLRGLKIR